MADEVWFGKEEASCGHPAPKERLKPKPPDGLNAFCDQRFSVKLVDAQASSVVILTDSGSTLQGLINFVTSLQKDGYKRADGVHYPIGTFKIVIEVVPTRSTR